MFVVEGVLDATGTEEGRVATNQHTGVYPYIVYFQFKNLPLLSRTPALCCRCAVVMGGNVLLVVQDTEQPHFDTTM